MKICRYDGVLVAPPPPPPFTPPAGIRHKKTDENFLGIFITNCALNGALFRLSFPHPSRVDAALNPHPFSHCVLYDTDRYMPCGRGCDIYYYLLLYSV